MSYIGRGTDKISNIEKLDTITFDGSSSYTLQKNSVNFTPNSANSLQVSIDGVVQAGNFTVSGSVIDFGVAIPATSTNDFIFHYGTGVVTTVADGAITTAKLGDASVTSAKLSGVTQGITMADQWRLTAVTNEGTDNVISTNWERNDRADFSVLGTGVSESSGLFSFPQTGLYYFLYSFFLSVDNGDINANIQFQTTQDNSTYTSASHAFTGNGSSSDIKSQVTNSYLFNVTNISNDKFRFVTNNFATPTYVSGSTTRQYSGFAVLRIGDSI